MGKSMSELAGVLKDEPLPTAGEGLDDLPEFGSWAPPPPPGPYRFLLPRDMSAIWDLIDVPEKTPPQRVRASFDRDHPLLIVQSPQGLHNQEPFETRLTNIERGRGKGKAVIASDLDYLLRALGEKTKPRSNREYMAAVQRHGGREFGGDIKYSWKCSRDRDIRVKKPDGQTEVIEGKKGCGESYYQEDVSKDASGQVPFETDCGKCGASLRAWANLDNLRP